MSNSADRGCGEGKKGECDDLRIKLCLCTWKLRGGTFLDGGSLVCLAEELLDVFLDIAGEEPPAVALEGDSVWTDEELLEVPGHVVPADWAPDDKLGVVDQAVWIIAGEWELFLEENKQGMGILPIHIHLLQEMKPGLEAISRPDVLQRQEDFFVLAVLLQGWIK